MDRKVKLLLAAIGVGAVVVLANVYVCEGWNGCDAGANCPAGAMFCNCQGADQCNGNPWTCKELIQTAALKDATEVVRWNGAVVTVTYIARMPKVTTADRSGETLATIAITVAEASPYRQA